MSHSDREVEVETSGPSPKRIQSPVERWFLLDGNRWAVAGLFLAGAFLAFFVLGWSGVIDVGPEGPMTPLLGAFIAGNLTLVPIAITINQLVLSREFGKPHDLRERDQGVRQLRQDLKDMAGISSIPPAPEAYLRELIATTDEIVASVDGAMTTVDSDEVRRSTDRFREEAFTSTDRVTRALDETDFGSYELLSAMLKVNSAWLMGTAEYLRSGHAETLPDEPFDRMEEVLRTFNVTRQYMKTLYAQREIAELSRLLLYTGFYALLVSALGMLAYATPIVAELSETSLLAAFSLVGTVVFAPLAFLTSYILRLSTLMSYPPLRNSFITDG